MNDKSPLGTAEWYRQQARRFIHLAAMAIIPQIKTQLMDIAREYETHAQDVQKKAQSPR